MHRLLLIRSIDISRSVHGPRFYEGVRKGVRFDIFIIYIREENIGFRFRVHANHRLIVSPEFLEMKFLSFIVCLGDIKFPKQFLFSMRRYNRCNLEPFKPRYHLINTNNTGFISMEIFFYRLFDSVNNVLLQTGQIMLFRYPSERKLSRIIVSKTKIVKISHKYFSWKWRSKSRRRQNIPRENKSKSLFHSVKSNRQFPLRGN